MWGIIQHAPPLFERIEHKPQLVVIQSEDRLLEVPHPAVNELGASGGSARAKIFLFYNRCAQASAYLYGARSYCTLCVPLEAQHSEQKTGHLVKSCAHGSTIGVGDTEQADSQKPLHTCMVRDHTARCVSP
jgi:hypothetical protein